MKHIFQTKVGKYYLRFAAVLSLITLVIAGTFALYTNQANKRGVISTAAANILFSSNYMELCAPNTDEPSSYPQTSAFLTPETGSTTVDVVVSIRNYYGSNTTQVNDSDITYDFKLELSGSATDTDKYKITFNGVALSPNDGDNSWSCSGNLLSGEDPNSHTLIINMPVENLGLVTFVMSALPDTDSLSATGHQMLAARLTPMIEGTTQGFTSSGRFTDADRDKEPANYDAFNYEVTISTGRATTVLTWDNTKVEIDPFFVSEKGGTVTNSGTESSYTFVMDSADASTELITFYRLVGPEDTSWQPTWADMANIVKLHCEQITTTNTTP